MLSVPNASFDLAPLSVQKIDLPFRVSHSSRVLKFKEPAGTSRGVMQERRVWYVEARAMVGGKAMWGIGECAPLPRLSCDDLPDYEEKLAMACRLWEQTHRIPRETLLPYPSILMGLETAERSLNGTIRWGDPFCVFNSTFGRGEAGILINGLVWMGTAEEMRRRMEDKLRCGFRCIKLKIGALDFEEELALIGSLRNRFSEEMTELRLDANGAFSPKEAIGRLEQLSRMGIHSMEQPISAGQWEEMAYLCRESPIPIALDEELIGINQREMKIRLLDEIRPQFIVLKPSLHGGFSGIEEWENLADERGIGHWVTSALESNVGLNAIAQWYAFRKSQKNACEWQEKREENEFPQGLGTGALFVENHQGVRLEIVGDRLWRETAEDRQQLRAIRQFECDWNDASVKTFTLHTSGSTGVPQQVEAKKRDMQMSAERTIAFFGLSPGSTALLCLPTEYVAGLMMLVRTVVGRLNLISVVPTLHPYRELSVAPDFAALTPAQAAATLEVPSERHLLEETSCLLLGGGRVSDRLAAQLQCCRGAVWSSYGMTETLSHVALRRINGADQSEFYMPLEGVRISKTIDGCLQIDDDVLQLHALKTHDLGEINADGTFRVLGRTDNVINSGGLKFDLEDLETKLADLPFRFMLTAVPDANYGEVLTLLIEATSVAAETLKEWGVEIHAPGDLSTCNSLLSLCRTRLERRAVPKHFFLIDQLPRTKNGKLARSAARDVAKKRMNLD